MIKLMTQAGYVAKNQLDGLENAITEAAGDVHVLICSMDYKYAPELELTGVVDGKNIEKLARNAGVEDIVALYVDI